MLPDALLSLPPSARLFYLALGREAVDGVAEVTFQRVQELTGIRSRNSLARILRSLVGAGLLEVTREMGKTNKYRLL